MSTSMPSRKTGMEPRSRWWLDKPEVNNSIKVNQDGGFCRDALWDTRLLITSAWPRFTDCFQTTVLVFVPCVLFWLPLPFYLGSLAKGNGNAKPLPLSRLAMAKMFLALSIAFISLFFIIDGLGKGAADTPPSEYLAYSLRAVTYAALGWLTLHERTRGVTSSGITVTLLVAFLLFDLVPLTGRIMTKEYEDELLKFCLFVIAHGFQLLSFCLNCVADNYGVETPHPRTSPEILASFISRIFYLWITKTVYRGWRRDLTEDDLLDLHPRDSSKTMVPVFERLWASEVKRVHPKGVPQGTKSEDDPYHSDIAMNVVPEVGSKKKEHQRLINSHDTDRKLYGGVDEARDKARKKRTRPSLLRVLTHMNKSLLAVAFLQKLFSDIFSLTSPFLLSLLVVNADHPDDTSAMKGYSLTVLLFVVALLKSVLFNSCFWVSQITGIQTKATLIAAIYKKALTMSSQSKKSSTMGEIVNMMSVDCQRIQEMVIIIFYTMSTPIDIVIVVAVLYQYIGASVFAGLGVLLLTVPVNFGIARLQRRLQSENLNFKDMRLRLTNEAMTGIKVLKLYAWEPPFSDKISETRDQEIRVLFKIALANAMSSVVFYFSPFLVTLATIAVYVNASDENVLDSKTALVTLSYFSLLTNPLQLLATIITRTVQALVSIDRINTFLCADDLDPSNVIKNSDALYAVTITNGTFTWDKNAAPTIKRVSLYIPDGQAYAVVGPVASGKSSLMMAILGEMEKISGSVIVKGSVAYVPQQAWIQNATVRDNILFGKPYSKKKYQAVIEACALERDLQILSAGDMTEIGEKGINLSGGQKQRVSLARACYSDADIYLLDDSLSAVDSHVGRHIFNAVISKKGLLRKKTRFLVTHGSHWLPLVDNILVMDKGQISESGSYEDLMSQAGHFATFIRTFQSKELLEEQGEQYSRYHTDTVSGTSDDVTSGDERSYKRRRPARRRKMSTNYDEQNTSQSAMMQSEMTVYDEDEASKGAGRLVEVETVERGRVKLVVFAKYLKAAGPVCIVASFLLFAAFQALGAMANFWLTTWAQDALLNNRSMQGTSEYRHKRDFYLGVFGAFGIAQVLFLGLYNLLYWTRMVIAAKKFHISMLLSVFRSPMAFFDTTPLGRIMNRFSRDLEVVDNNLPIIIRDYLTSLAVCAVVIVVISINTPLFLALAVPLVIVFLVIQQIYIPGARQLKRIESVTRSPIYSHFSETISGGATIRCFGASARFVEESQRRVDRNQSFYYFSMVANRWLGMWLEFLSDLIILGAALFGVVTPGTTGAAIGLSISYAIQVSHNLVWLVRQTSELETNIVSVERLKEYSELPSEADWLVPHRMLDPKWPQGGEVEFKGYKTRYRQGLDLVLKGIDCTLYPGEKIGIVGRTGAGKSSLALALFRLIEASQGAILVDGVEIAGLGLHDVRSSLTILPQDPVLFFGSLRMNLDPVNQYTDDQLWNALTSAHLKAFVRSLPGCLDFEVGEEGQNLSVGQRQLVCLARALLKKTRILILDEATAAVDMKTDKLIQDTIRTEFDHCTVISIAHRLNTILDYDRIMVLDNGVVKELDTPTNLLGDANSVFYSMAKEANLV